jgi:TP901 family phage tail tape measure protein
MSRFVLTAQLQLQAPSNVSQVVRQIQSQLNNVNVNVQVQGAQQAQRQIQQLTRSTDDATSSADRMGRVFAISVRRFAAFSIATRAVGLFTSTLSSAVREAIDFQREMVRVSQVTGEALGKLTFLTKAITDLSTGLGVSSKDLLTTGQLLLQAGVNAKDTEIALKTLAKAALAPNFDSLSETTEGAIAILAQFQEGVGSLEKQLGSINAVAGAFAVEAGDLIDVIRRTGGVFKASGGSLNELLALFTSVRATTRESAESIGTGLRTIFTRIQRPKTIEFLRQFGIELVDLNGKFVGPFEAARKLSEALSGLGEGDLTFIRIAEELGGFRQIGKVLPLLQQFSTAQAALNVAQNAGNSLTKDAETAQAALAIRITKVKEEFLALVRSVTETTTFQVMANTALTLASALIQVADSLKGLLPLLGALAAVKIARGLGNFVGGISGGLTSGRTFNKGGKVLAFARGGMVPGTGNRDTVPAMLSPGEFVIRKSSVQKLGAGNLAAMNENRFAAGGLASQNQAGMAIPDTFGENSFKSSNIPVNLSEIANATPQSGPLKSGSLLSQFAFKNNKTVQANSPNILPAKEFKEALQTAFGFTSKTYVGKTAGVSSSQKTEFNRILTDQMQQAIKNGASQWSNSVGVPLSPTEITFGEQFTLAPGLAGSFFESVVDAFQGRPIGAEASENKRPFDFITGLRGGANSKLFSNLQDVDYIDAKKSASLATDSEYKKKIASQLAIDGYDEVKNSVQKTYASLINQLPAKKYFGGIIQKFATGGGVGTDTVPALLTPGEFVINRKAAQNIGYGSLNRMNKVGKYAKGGIVQRFAQGGTASMPDARSSYSAGFIGSGGLDSSQNLIPFDMLTKQANALAQAQQNLTRVTQQASQTQTALHTTAQQVEQSQQQQTRSIGETVAANKMFAAAMTVSLIQGFLPAIDQNSSTLLKLSHGFVGLISTITSIGFALEAFGVNLSIQELTSLDKMANRLGLVFDKVGSIASNLYTSITKVITGKAAEAAASTSAATADAAETAASSTATSADIAEAAGSVVTTQADLAEAAASTVAMQADLEEAAASLAAAAANNAEAAQSVTQQASALGRSLGAFAIGATVAYLAVKTFSDALRKSAENMNKSKIEAGDVEGARQSGENLPRVDFAELLQNVGGVVGTVGGGVAGGIIGGTAGSIVPGAGTAAGVALGTAAGAAAGGITGAAAGRGVGNLINMSSDALFGTSNSINAAGSVSASAAQMVKTNKILENSSDKAAKALESIEAGTMSFRAALDSLSIETQSSVDAMKLAKEANAAEEKVINNQSTGMGRTIRAYATLGYVDSNEEIQDKKNKVSERTREAQRIGQQQLAALQPIMQKQMRRTAATGGDFDSFLDSLTTAEFELLNLTDGGIKNAYQSFINIQKEIDITKAALEAMNLGLRGPEATANAMSASLERFAAGLEVGGDTFSANAEFLSVAMSSAAQAMNPDDIKAAISDVGKNLEELGVSPQYRKKFEENTQAFIKAQQGYSNAFDNIKNGMAADDFNQLSGDELKDAFAKELTAGLGEEAKKSLTAVIRNIDLSDPEELNKILSGNYELFGQKLGEAGQKQIEQIKQISAERKKAEDILIGFIQKRIEAERELLEAQKEALSLRMEGREVQGKYGGIAVTNAERRANVLARANVGAANMGLSNLRTGSAAEFRRRSNEITGNFAAVEQRRRQDGGMQGGFGVAASAAQQDLQKAQKDQIQTIRELIKLEEDELKIIQEKNRLEKQSLESLITGDIEKFFEQQAAVGATAAIATGNDQLMNQFGASALAGAFADIQRQAEAGVQSLYGVRLAGAGGLGEQAAGAALAARGVQNPAAARSLAGTTPEEEAARARLRDLGGALGESGNTAIDMAQMELGTAEMNVAQANIILNDVTRRGQEAAAGFNRGGIVYASKGMFIPKGSDTVPAMLTPGEFVVNRRATRENIGLLRAINSGQKSTYARRGGRIGGTQYLAQGGTVAPSSPGISLDPKVVTDLSNALKAFNTDLATNITNLQNTKLQIRLETANININFQGASFLAGLRDQVQRELMSQVASEITKYKVGPNGKLTKSESVL